MTTPRFLYRYRPFHDYVLTEIAFNAVHPTGLNAQNDPHEGMLQFKQSDPNTLRQQLTERALADGEPEHALLLNFLPDKALRQIDEQARAIAKSETNARETWGLLSFTERRDNKHLWMHYAQNLTGVVIEYDIGSCEVGDGALLKVVYSTRRGKTAVDEALAAPAGSFAEVLKYKNPKWAAEEEWRLLVNMRNRLLKFVVPISSVILGANMDQASKARVAGAIVRNGQARMIEMVKTQSPDQFRMLDHAGPIADQMMTLH